MSPDLGLVQEMLIGFVTRILATLGCSPDRQGVDLGLYPHLTQPWAFFLIFMFFS